MEEQKKEPSIEQQPSQEASSSEVNSQIPEKFLNASKMDILQAYKELEKERGRLANEVGELRKIKEDYDSRIAQLEASLSQVDLSKEQQPMAASPEVDPVEVIRSKFDEDPASAIAEALKLQEQKLLQQTQALTAEQQKALSLEWVEKKRKEDPDFSRREKKMLEIAQAFKDVFNPAAKNSIQFLRLIDLASKGADLDYYQQQALASAEAKKQEKQQAFSESSSRGSLAGEEIDLSKLSHEEYIKAIEELYGHAD